MTLIAHRGGWEATPADLASVPVPEDTDTWKAVPYPRLIEEVKLHIPRFGLRVEDERYALARDGNHMFGALTCQNGHVSDWGLAIGIRSSYDRSLAVGLVAGSRVFVCDNLAFHSDAGNGVHRKHTVNIWRDLPELVYNMLGAVAAMKSKMNDEIDVMKAAHLTTGQAHDIMIRAVRANALPASKLPRVIEAYDGLDSLDFEPETAWSLFNAFTEVQKSRTPWDQMDGTLRLSQVFREVLSTGL